MRSVLVSRSFPARFPATLLSSSFFHFFFQENSQSHKNPVISVSRCLILPFLSLLNISRNPSQIRSIQTPKVLANGLINSRMLQSSAIDTARLIFNQIKNPLLFHYNSVIQAYSKSDAPDLAISFYVRMLERGVRPNHFTFPSLISACGGGSTVSEGTQMHSHVLKMGFAPDQFLQCSLIHMYSNFSDMNSARKLFDEMTEKNVVVWTALVNGYSKSGQLEIAKRTFDAMTEKDVVAWSAMISGYVQHGRFKEGLTVFNGMQVEGVEANESVLVSVLSACAHLGALDLGRWVHLYLERRFGHELSVSLGTALVDMYAKCGDLSASLDVFQGLPCKNVLTWNAMMGGFALYGNGRGALGLWSSMLKMGMRSDEVTFLALLGAFSHGGLVNEGRTFFEAMNRIFFINPTLQHYACMVDILARAGLLEEATELVRSMPMEPDACVWGALLGGCKVHENVELGILIGENLLKCEPDHAGRYVLLSNIYASAGRWDDSRYVRVLMEERGVKSRPGCSLIEVNGQVHEFVVGERSHPHTRKIYSQLEEMSMRLKMVGYNVETRNVLYDMDDEDKEVQLSYHSEKLAIAFGLIFTESRSPIRIVKNLRVCSDCHMATRLLSKIYERDIIVRDSKRFHHFKDGSCSCGDYW